MEPGWNWMRLTLARLCGLLVDAKSWLRANVMAGPRRRGRQGALVAIPVPKLGDVADALADRVVPITDNAPISRVPAVATSAVSRATTFRVVQRNRTQ